MNNAFLTFKLDLKNGRTNSMSHHKYHHPSCLNCHYPLAEFDKFCPNCGQKPMSPKSSMHDLLHEFFHTFWHLDGKFFMTLHHLLIPGKLTTEFFKGHLKRYAHPIQLFLVLGAFAFGTLASKARKAEEGAQRSVEKRRDEYKRKAFLHELDSARKSLIPPQYADAKSQLLSDSLMYKMMYPDDIELDKEKVEILVMGMPKRLNNEDTDTTAFVKNYIEKLKLAFPNTPLETIDERFTSSMALDAMIAGGMKKKDRREKGNVDKISATIILQSYMESKSRSY